MICQPDLFTFHKKSVEFDIFLYLITYNSSFIFNIFIYIFIYNETFPCRFLSIMIFLSCINKSSFLKVTEEI